MLIYSYFFFQAEAGIRYLKMQRPSSAGEAQQQAARRILVLRITFDDLRLCARLADFLLADVPLHHAPKGVPAELESSGGQFLRDMRQCFHLAGLWPGGNCCKNKGSAAAAIFSICATPAGMDG